MKRMVKASKTSFGFSLNLKTTKDVVIVCVNDGTGLVPIKLCLPHQIYTKDLQRWLKEYPNTKAFTVIPASSEEYEDVWLHETWIPTNAK